MSLEVHLTGGGVATIVATDGHFVTLEGARAYPPGATLEGRGADGSGIYRVKVRGSQRRTSAEVSLFRIDGRFVNLSRPQREHLMSAI